MSTFLGAVPVRLPLQALALVLLAAVAGGTFTIWRGYNPSAWAPITFVEAHQGAVRGLNALLPGLAIGSGLLALLLALSAPRGWPVALYSVAVLLILVGGAVTRLGNQPINAIIMTWLPAVPPADWMDLRDRWWIWHQIRTGLTCLAFLALVAAVQTDLLRQTAAARQ